MYQDSGCPQNTQTSSTTEVKKVMAFLACASGKHEWGQAFHPHTRFVSVERVCEHCGVHQMMRRGEAEWSATYDRNAMWRAGLDAYQ